MIGLRGGSAAQRADCLQVGDSISAINGTKVSHMKADEISQILRASNERIHLEIEYELPPPTTTATSATTAAAAAAAAASSTSICSSTSLAGKREDPFCCCFCFYFPS